MYAYSKKEGSSMFPTENNWNVFHGILFNVPIAKLGYTICSVKQIIYLINKGKNTVAYPVKI